VKVTHNILQLGEVCNYVKVPWFPNSIGASIVIKIGIKIHKDEGTKYIRRHDTIMKISIGVQYNIHNFHHVEISDFTSDTR